MNIDSNVVVVAIITAFSAIFATFLAGILAFWGQRKLKKLENATAERKEKEHQKLKFYIPLLRCLYELDDRFERILNNLETDWLNGEYLENIKNGKGFALDPNNKGYFIISSIYLIASFFGLTEAIKRGVDTSKLTRNKIKITFLIDKLYRWAIKKLNLVETIKIFQFDPDVTKVCRLFQYEELFKCYMTSKTLVNPKDACKLHKHIQHSIGEMMLEKESVGEFRIKSFREFYDAYVSKKSFRFWFTLIENLFTDLSNFEKEKNIEKKVEMKNDIRPLRIIAIQYWCRILMKKISKELNLEGLGLQTRPADDVLETLGDELADTIREYKLDYSAAYLLSV